MTKERVLILMDGNNFYNSSKLLSLVGKINFEKLIKELIGERELVNVFYYVAPLDIKIDSERYWKHEKFLSMLRKIPKFNVVLCTLRKVKKKEGGYEFVLKEDDIHLAGDLVEKAFRNLYDTAIIVSGDEDFVPVIKIVQKIGKKVENVYFSSSSSRTLRNICDYSICLNKITSKIIK